ncbi:MAG: HAD-IIB family hydrolase [Tannerella sp.]|nr:HAD-IIB family hydrolase [Tannerella sp.]
MKIESYSFPNKVKSVICSDLDETFLPFADEHKPYSGIAGLEQYLSDNIESKSMIFGWITGSNLSSVLRKTKGYITRYPHFVASSLGTEFHWIINNEIKESDSWRNRIVASGYEHSNVDLIVAELEKQDIYLEKEDDDYQGIYKSTYYYHINGDTAADFLLMEKLAAEYHVKVLFNKCTLRAGDPENCYDIEFMPHGCGKGEVVDFLIKELDVSPENVYCFGDSFNDFSMFARTKNAFLVGNADPEAKRQHPQVLEKEYCYGIRSKLEELLN